MNHTTKHAIAHAFLASIYIVLIVLLLSHFPESMRNKPDTILAPMFVLSLLVLSAGTMAILFFGKPIMWYLDNKKKDALSLLFQTFGIFFIAPVVFFIVMFFI